MSAGVSSDLQARLAAIRLFLCDVDGVLTDASVFIGGAQEVKRFNIRDGLGMVLLRENGVRVGWISSRISSATTLRGQELKIDFIHMSKMDKVQAIREILGKTGCTWEQVCYIGDDIVDLGALRHAGVAVAVPDAVPEAKAAAHYVTQAPGGHGAVREVAEMILKAQNKWETAIASRNQETAG